MQLEAGNETSILETQGVFHSELQYSSIQYSSAPQPLGTTARDHGKKFSTTWLAAHVHFRPVLAELHIHISLQGRSELFIHSPTLFCVVKCTCLVTGPHILSLLQPQSKWSMCSPATGSRMPSSLGPGHAGHVQSSDWAAHAQLK